MNITYQKIAYQDCLDIIKNKHYAHRIPSISYACGVKVDDEIMGIVTFGSPASSSLCKGVCGVKYKSNVIELNRLWLDDSLPKNTASQLIGYAFHYLRQQGDFIVVSYADSGMEHIGAIYQATNFLFTGKTKPRTDKYSGIGKHSRHYDKNAVETYRQLRTSKYRYIIFIGNKTFKKNVRKALNYPVLPYIKHDSKHYNVGDSQTIYLKDMSDGSIIKESDINVQY